MTYSILGTDTTTNQPVLINKTVRPQGLYIVGRQGTGKSNLIEALIIQDIKQGLGVCVLDPHHTGGIIDNIIARLPANREKDVILLDIRDYQFPFGLNLFACSDPTNPLAMQVVVDRVMHVFEKLFSVTHDTPLIWEYLYNCTHTIVMNPGMTMAEIPLLLMDKICRQQLVANVKKSEVRLFWQRYEMLKPDEQAEQSAPTLRRVNALLQDITKYIVGQSNTTIDVRASMDERHVLLVRLDSLTLGDTTDLTGSLIIAAFLNAAPTRTKTQNLFNIYADEFQNFATEDFVKLIEEARKYGIGITIAHQNRAQLALSNKQAEIELKKRVLNVGSLVVFCVPTDGPELAGQFDTRPPVPESVSNWQPILTPKADVLTHLREQGHTNPQVQAFSHDYLVPMLRVIETHRRSFYKIRVNVPIAGQPSCKVQISDLNEACHQLNRLLFEVQTTRNANIAIPPFVAYQFLKLYGFAKFFNWAWYWPRVSFVSSRELPSLFIPKDELKLLCATDYQAHGEAIAVNIPPRVLAAAIDFITSLRKAMEALAKQPVLINVGQHIAIYDKPRPYVDVQHEIANRLVGLADYIAWVKIKGDTEHIIQTLQPEKGLYGKALENRIAGIQHRNRTNTYTRPRQAVEQEILKRQSQWSGHQQSPQQQPRSRGSVVCQNCGAQNSQGSHFCNQCGKPL